MADLRDTKSAEQTEQLDSLRKSLLSELDECLIARNTLKFQASRVAKRIRTIEAQLGLPPQSFKLRKHFARRDGVRAMLLAARGPMSIDAVSREIEKIEGKRLPNHSVWSFLERHPRYFVNVGRGLWDVREKWSDSDLEAELRRQNELKIEKELRKD
jgi:hypothetical protein